jgi:restriction system protein
MTYLQVPWKQYSYKLESFERLLKAAVYRGNFDPPADNRDSSLPNGSLVPEQVSSMLSAQSLGPPHGLQLLEPLPIPNLPKFPPRPTEAKLQYQDWIADKADTLEQRYHRLLQEFQARYLADAEKLALLQQGCMRGDHTVIGELVQMSHTRHPYPAALHGALTVHLDANIRLVLCELEVPDFAPVTIVRKRGSSWKAKWAPVAAAERRRLIEAILYALCLRAAYLTAASDSHSWFETVAINVHQKWHDPATGAVREGIIASLQAPKTDLLALRLDQVDPKTCFRHLKGLATPSLAQVSPIRPIFVLNTNDQRIIENRNVADQIDRESNLAAMPWEDFEQLVRQLFEWEFGRNGIEVKVTRASRDRGVDAIMFDPDPLRGGRFGDSDGLSGFE